MNHICPNRMNLVLRFLAFGLMFLLVGCNQKNANRDSKPMAGQDSQPLEVRLLNADLERGEILALSCRACHTFGLNEGHMIGPNLHGIFQRAAVAGVDGFEYSDAFLEADFLWNPGTLDMWLADPSSFLPDSNMRFAGFSSGEDRVDLIAYLLQATIDPTL